MCVLLHIINYCRGYTRLIHTQFASKFTCQLQTDDLAVPLNYENEKAGQSVSWSFEISELN